MDHTGNPLNWICTVAIGIMAFISVLLTIWSLYSTSQHIKSLSKTTLTLTRTHSASIYSTLFAILLFTIASVLSSIMAIGSLIENDSKNNMTLRNIAKFALVFYLGAQSTITLVFTLRIEATYTGTILEYSPKLVNGLRVTIICLFIFGIFALSLLFAEMHDFVAICGFMWVILYCTLSITLMILFIRPINKLMKNHVKIQMSQTVTTPSISTTSISDDENKTEPVIDTEFLFMVIKHGLLVPIAIGSSFILFITGMVIGQVIDPAAYNTVAYVWIVMDCTVSSICIHLLCRENKNLYMRLCSKLHLTCEKRKKRKIMHNVQKEPDVNCNVAIDTSN